MTKSRIILLMCVLTSVSIIDTEPKRITYHDFMASYGPLK